jgi:hypothetical protein
MKMFNEFQEKQPHGCYFIRPTNHQLFVVPISFFYPVLWSVTVGLLTITRSTAQSLNPITSSNRQAINHQQHLPISSAAPTTKIAQNQPSIRQPALPAPPIFPSPVNPAVPGDLGTPSQTPNNPAFPQPTPSPDVTIPAVTPSPTPSPVSQSPRARDPKTVKPITTSITIDGTSFTHRSEYELSTGIDAGDKRSANLSWDATWLTGVTISESTSKDRVYRRDYQSQYNRFSSFRQERKVVTSVVAPETAIGFRQQISLVADCIPGTPLGADGKPQTCTYVPGLATDRSSIDNKLIPRRFLTTSNFQDIVSPASLEAMKQPGFQAGANGEEFAVDLYVPLAGTRPGNALGNTSQVDRREFITNSPAITVGKMRQVILSNGQDNALGRTVRGFTYVGEDPNFTLNSAFTLAANALPDVEPTLEPGVEGKPAFSTTLFIAADNTRLPENSFTAYLAGWGRSQTPKEGNPIPTANYHGVWLGLSPIVNRRIISDRTFETTIPERITSVQGNEGGIANNINVDININGQNFNSFGLTNAYSQGYLTIYERGVNSFNSFIIQEKTSYNPHMSFTGNITTANSVLRYYTGGIFIAGTEEQPQTFQAYIGGDFKKSESSGLSYTVGAIGYVNPNPDNYSQLNANVAQQIRIGNNPQNSLTLSSSALYALDGSSDISDVLFRSGNSYVNAGANLKIGNIAFATTYFIPTGLPNEIESQLITSISWRVADNLILSGYYTPINNNTSRSTMGASTSWRMGQDPNSPTLSLSWNRNEIDFGRGSTTPINNYSDNVFGVYFRFGAPGNPFIPANP